MKRLLLITYDLNRPGQNYNGVHEAIKNLGAWWHYLESTWLVHSAASVNQATDSVRAAMDPSDSLLVIDITGDAYNGWLTEDAWDWIRQRISGRVTR